MESNQSGSLSTKRATDSNPVKLLEAVMSEGLEENEIFSGHGIEKRMKKDDSGIHVNKCGMDSSDDEPVEFSIQLKRKESGADVSELNSPDSGNQEGCSLNDFHENNVNMETVPDDSVSQNSPAPVNLVKNSENSGGDAKKSMELDSDDDSSPQCCDDDVEEDETSKKDDGDKSKTKVDDNIYDPTPTNLRPKHKWAGICEAIKREYGTPVPYSPDIFRYKCYGSLHMVERLELMYKMKQHEGCVNALNFNTAGTKLASGSDDLDIVIWDWTVAEPILKYNSGHRSNVFQAKFMPLSGDCQVVSCARDGQVRIAELSTTGRCKSTRKLAQHKGAAHKLAIQTDSPHTFLSCGEDAAVFEIDLREGKPEKLLLCKENDKKVPLYSIFINPNNPYQYVVGGRDHYVRVYDKRYTRENNGVLKKYCPEHLVDSDIRANVTSVVYSYNGQEILASFNDEDIYTFDSSATDTSKYLHRYRGHRNSQTVKGVNFFGLKSEYVVSGSDCGHIYFWEKESEHIIKFMQGDEGGVVNCLEPHPNLPVLATSGLDDDIKIWVPSCEEMPDLSGLKNLIINNMKEREDERRQDGPETFDDQMLWFLMQHLRRARRRAQHRDQDVDTTSSSSSDSENNEDEDGLEFNQAIQCSQS